MQTYKRSVYFFLFCILSFTVLAQKDSAQVPLDPQVRIGKLPNGLTYYIHKNAKPEKRVELRLVVNTGSILEDEKQLGLAHFMEHMNFNGTKRFPKNELVNYLQSIGVEFGADLNAYTSFEETVYMLPVPTDKPELVDKGLQILEDWAHNALLDSLEIEKERGVVLEEWRTRLGADDRMMRQTLPVQFKGSLYADRLPIGTETSLRTFTHSDLKRFYKDWYRPDLQAVVVVGDINVNEIEQKIKQYFSDIPAATSPRKRELFPVPDHDETLVTIAKDPESAFTAVEVMVKKDKAGFNTVNDYSRYIRQSLFSGMLNNRLQELARKPNPPFIGAGGGYGSTFARTKDAYNLFAYGSDTAIHKALYSLMEENRRVAMYGFTPAEFDRQKKQMLSMYERMYNERDKQESGAIVNEYVKHFLTGEPAPGIAWEYNFVKEYIPNVKLEDINAFVKEWLTTKNMVVTVTASDKPGTKVPAEAEIRKVLADVGVAKIEAYQEKAIASELLSKSKLKPGKTVSEVKNAKIGTTTIKLSNGVTVILKPTDFKNDEVLLQGFSKGGQSLVANPDHFSATYAAQIVSESGVGEFSSTDLRKMLQGRNTSVNTSIGMLTEGVNGRTTPKELETMLQLVHLYFTAPRKDKDAFTSFITKNKQLYKNLASDPQFYYSNELQKILTQNHPRGGGLPQPENFDKVNHERAWSIYKERFANAGDFTFFMVGAFEPEKVKPLLETYLGSLPSQPKKETFKDLGVRPPKGKVDKEIKKGTEPKSMVTLVYTAPATYNAKEAYALTSLGEVMTIKLIEQLREEKGGVYGAGAFGFMNKNPYGSAGFSIQFPCSPENVEPLTKAALDELRKIQQAGVSKEDLNKVKEQQKRKIEVSMKQNNFWMSSLYDAYFNGKNPDDILLKEKEIDNLNSKMIQDVANKYINVNNYIRATLKPEKVEKKEEKKTF